MLGRLAWAMNIILASAMHAIPFDLAVCLRELFGIPQPLDVEKMFDKLQYKAARRSKVLEIS